MCSTCEKCGKVAKSRYDIAYDEDMDMHVCGACSDKFEAGVEEHEERKRRRIAEDNEY